jgi:hypothetical protein
MLICGETRDDILTQISVTEDLQSQDYKVDRRGDYSSGRGLPRKAEGFGDVCSPAARGTGLGGVGLDQRSETGHFTPPKTLEWGTRLQGYHCICGQFVIVCCGLHIRDGWHT